MKGKFDMAKSVVKLGFKLTVLSKKEGKKTISYFYPSFFLRIPNSKGHSTLFIMKGKFDMTNQVTSSLGSS